MYDEQRKIELKYIDEPPQAMRTAIEPEAVRLLAESIRKEGLINPITVRPRHKLDDVACTYRGVGKKECFTLSHNRFEVVAGHRRLLACRMAPLNDVPCVVRELSDAQVFDIMSAENLAREDVNPVDQAIHIGRLIGEDYSRIPEVAHRLHYSIGWVEDRLAILEYPENFLPHVRSGALSLGVAKHLSGVESEFWRNIYLEQALKFGISVTQAKYLAAQSALGLTPEPGATPPVGEGGAPLPPSLMKAPCEACGLVAIDPNLKMVWVHVTCPQQDEADVRM